MANDTVSKLFDKWMNDQTFRSKIRKDPQGTLKAMKITLTPEEQKAFNAIDWKLTDEQLKARVNKLC